MGTAVNSIADIIGGGLGGQLLGMLMGDGAMVDPAAAAGSLDIASIVQSIAGGGIGGGVVLAIVSVLKKALAKG